MLLFFILMSAFNCHHKNLLKLIFVLTCFIFISGLIRSINSSPSTGLRKKAFTPQFLAQVFGFAVHQKR
jgi:hypothetical protein